MVIFGKQSIYCDNNKKNFRSTVTEHYVCYMTYSTSQCHQSIRVTNQNNDYKP